MRLDRGDLRGLVLLGIQPVHVADDDLQRHDDAREDDRELQHELRALRITALPQVHRRDAARRRSRSIRYAASVMCTKRYGNDGLKTTANQLSG